MPNVEIKSIMLSIILLNVVMLSVVASMLMVHPSLIFVSRSGLPQWCTRVVIHQVENVRLG
jgi:hypothetical protein